jgi:hypothetical protein
MRNKKVTGITGSVAYEVGDKQNSYNKTTHMLAQYAYIGGNKTAAYGQTSLH